MNNSTAILSVSTLSFLLTIIWGTPFLHLLRRLKIGKLVRVEGPKSHYSKIGTPTMGGLLFIFPTILFNVLLNAAEIIKGGRVIQSYLVPLSALVAFAVIGGIDDWEGIRGARRGLGMRARTKFLLQVILAAVFAYVIKEKMGISQFMWMDSPYPIEVGYWFYPIAILLIVGMSNAVNLTDGMDGLAGLISATAFAAYGIICMMQGAIGVSRFCFILVGALFGFLWFNVNPAMMFMGDVGSLGLGAALAVVALISQHWLVLPIIAIIPVSEALSVMLQVGYFKLTHGRRIFRMAPIHHHFQEIGWSEMQVVQRFWLIGLLFAMLGVGLASL